LTPLQQTAQFSKKARAALVLVHQALAMNRSLRSASRKIFKSSSGLVFWRRLVY
jgi:hypothetical protein